MSDDAVEECSVYRTNWVLVGQEERWGVDLKVAVGKHAVPLLPARGTIKGVESGVDQLLHLHGVTCDVALWCAQAVQGPSEQGGN